MEPETESFATPPGRAADGSGEPPVIFGIKAKLLSAFATLAALTVIAGAVAVYGFFLIDRTVTRITVDSIPTMAASLRIAEQSAEIASIAPALMASSNQQERVREHTRLQHALQELDALTRTLEARGAAPDEISTLQGTQARIESTLAELDAQVAARLDMAAARESALKELALIHNRFSEVLEPVVDDAYFDLVMRGERATQESSKSMTTRQRRRRESRP